MIEIYHNARCSKSRDCLLMLKQDNQEIVVRNYLIDQPNVEEIEVLLSKLDIPPIELVRKTEPVWIEKFKNKQLSDREIIQAMAEHPILIERPIVVNGNKAVIARPASRVSEIL